jgi:photosystem II stability/assembly factor-like uncharacterized protein
MIRRSSRCVVLTCLLMMNSGDLLAGWKKIFDKDVARCFLTIGNAIVVGSDTGCYRSLDRGGTWAFYSLDPLRSQGGTIGISSLSRNNRYIFAATNAGVYTTADTGRTWRAVGPSPGGKPLLMIKAFAHGEFVLATMAGGGLFRSENDGLTWTYLGPHRQYDYIVQGDTLFAGAMDGIWYSRDRGWSWTQCGGFPPYAQAVEVARNDKFLFADAFDRIYRSADFGSSWSILNTGMPIVNHHMDGLFVDGSNVFVGLSGHRIYYSKDNGDHWIDISGGLDTIDREATLNRFCRSDNWVLSNIDGLLWYYEVSEITDLPRESAGILDKFELHQNYPNPFNPSTNLEFRVSRLGFVCLKVFDVLGREVATLVNEVRPAGAYRVRWDASIEPSGVYFYRLQSGESVETKRMVFLR